MTKVLRNEQVEWESESTTCYFNQCYKEPLQLVQDKAAGRVVWACQQHADGLLTMTDPEYDVGCPNCGCRFGIN